jgi:hypothetical protein
MKIKQLIETASWKSLSVADFKDRATHQILEQKETIEKLSNIITRLEEDIQILKNYIGINKIQNNKTTKLIKSNTKVDDANARI